LLTILFKMKYFSVALVILMGFFSCAGQTNANMFSLVFLNDSFAAYNGFLEKNSVVKKDSFTSASITKILKRNKEKYGNNLIVIIKPAPCGDGTVKEKLNTVIYLLTSMGIKNSVTFKLTEKESKYFNTESRELPN